MHATLAELFPADGIVVLESPSSTAALRNQLRLSRPGSYYFSAGGGLGFGLAAALGVQLAQPERQVVCVLGEGSAQYAITAFWTAAAYEIPVKFLVLRNNEYSILKWFAMLESVERRAGPRPAEASTSPPPPPATASPPAPSPGATSCTRASRGARPGRPAARAGRRRPGMALADDGA